METNVLYGVTVVRPELCARIVVQPTTWWMVVQGCLAEAWYFVSQCMLFALSFTCFMFAAKAAGL